MVAVAVETVKKTPVSARPEQGWATGWAWLEGRDTAQTWANWRVEFRRDDSAGEGQPVENEHCRERKEWL